MLNGRLYRVAFVPFLLALAVAALLPGPRPLPLTSTLAPDAFEGQRALAALQRLAGAFPTGARAAPADGRARGAAWRTRSSARRRAGGGFSVRIRHSAGQTIDGERSSRR